MLGWSAWVWVSWAFVHSVSTHVEDTYKRQTQRNLFTAFFAKNKDNMGVSRFWHYLRRMWAPLPPSPLCTTRRNASCHSVYRNSSLSLLYRLPSPAAQRSLHTRITHAHSTVKQHVSEKLAGERLTGDEEEDASCKCLVKAVKGGVVNEGHDTNDNANEASQQGKNHEGPSGIPISCGQEGHQATKTISSHTISRHGVYLRKVELPMSVCKWKYCLK